MNLNYLKRYCVEKITDYPVLKEEISDFFYLACDEVEQGGSEMHETDLAIESINQLIEDHLETIKDLESELKQLKGQS